MQLRQTFIIAVLLLPLMSWTQSRSKGSIDKLLTGIYLEDRGIEIPWFTKFDSIDNYEKPTITRYDRNTFFVRWDSVTVFNGIRASMFYAANKNIFSKGRYQKLQNISFFVDTRHIQQLKKIFDNYFSVVAGIHRNKILSWYAWSNSEFMIKLINYDNKYARLLIQKSN